MFGLKTILHPTDFSEPSNYALDLACRLATDYGASLVIVHVMAAPHPPGGNWSFFYCEQISETNGKQLADSKPAATADAPEGTDHGNPAGEILQMAQLCQADLIVMGAHGRGLPARVTGSVAEVVMREAKCPVLTVTGAIVQRPEPTVISRKYRIADASV